MKNPNIFLVEDEIEIANILQGVSKNLDANLKHFNDGLEAFNYLTNSSYNEEINLIILDRMLPNKNGLDICKELRNNNKFNKIPILMLTALSTTDQIIEGLNAGADDYIAKPFDLNILTARIQSLIRRYEILNEKKIENQNLLILKGIKLDLDQCKVWINEEKIDLTLSEFKILNCFLNSPGKVLTRQQLVEYIQDGPIHVTDRTIDTHIFGLRKKLGNQSNMIETIRGIGYRVINND